MRLHVLSEAVLGTERPLTLIPGTLLAALIAGASFLLAESLGAGLARVLQLEHSPVSTFLLAIVLGMAVKNVVPLPSGFEAGLRFCLAKVLRAGIVLLGIRLSIVAVIRIGVVAALIVIVCVVTAILLTALFARWFGVSDRLGTLIAAGTSICGVSAVVAVSPAIGALEEETSYAISTVTIFGVVATLLYPYLAELGFGLSVGQAGLFLGTAVHDTSQVTGAAFIYDQLWAREVSRIAITTKLVRNALMVAVIPLLSVAFARRAAASGAGPGEGGARPSVWKVFPVFVLGFVALAVFRSVGDAMVAGDAGRFLFWSGADSWSGFHEEVKQVASYLLSLAIAAAGLSTDVAKLKRLSLRPFLVGLVAAVAVGVVSLLLVSGLGGVIAAQIGG
ncbi:MAG: YeiH family protein [Spirochaetaceae bacterium]